MPEIGRRADLMLSPSDPAPTPSRRPPRCRPDRRVSRSSPRDSLGGSPGRQRGLAATPRRGRDRGPGRPAQAGL